MRSQELCGVSHRPPSAATLPPLGGQLGHEGCLARRGSSAAGGGERLHNQFYHTFQFQLTLAQEALSAGLHRPSRSLKKRTTADFMPLQGWAAYQRAFSVGSNWSRCMSYFESLRPGFWAGTAKGSRCGNIIVGPCAEAEEMSKLCRALEVELLHGGVVHICGQILVAQCQGNHPALSPVDPWVQSVANPWTP